MLDQLIQLVQQAGKNTVVENPEVPDEYNKEVMADATKTITSGFQNVMAGGGFQHILDLFKGGKNNSGGGLLKNPLVTMMVGYFMNKLVGKYKMNPTSASNVANNLIPDVLGGLVNRTTSQDPENDAFDFNDLIGSLTGGNVPTAESSKGGFDFQGLLNQFTGAGKQNNDDGNGFNLEDIIGQVTRGARQNSEQTPASGGGLMDLIKNIMSR
jgi:hypothetical protein